MKYLKKKLMTFKNDDAQWNNWAVQLVLLYSSQPWSWGMSDF